MLTQKQILTLNEYYASEKRRKAFLQHVCNKYGNLRVSSSRKKDDITLFLKWSDIFELSENNKNYPISHRQIYPFELVFDIDEPEQVEGGYKFYNIMANRFDFKEVYLFSTGSKGIHIHLYLLDDYKKFVRYPKIWKGIIERIGRIYVTQLGYDSQKVNRNVTIAMEFAPHWKSGKQKQLIIGKGCFYERFAQIN